MVRVQKDDVQWLIEHKYMKLVKGKYPDLYISSKRKKHGGKRYWINENLLWHLAKK